MATVDIEPASLAVTPGESHVLTLTITNDGDDVEAYHVAAVDDAAAYVTIAPDTLLVRAGETGSAAATLALENTGKWPVGDIIVRFHVVPAGRPDDFLIVEAIATIQSFSDVAAVLTPEALEAFRSATAEVTIANAGNAHTYAEVSLSAGELALTIDQSHVALPADSAETVGLRVGAGSLLWRGAPIQHPFVVTVSPEGGQTISLDGTFTQRPLLPRWSRTAAIAVGAAVAVALLVWGVASFAALRSDPVASTPSPTGSATPALPEPVVSVAANAPALDEAKGGDNISVALEPDIAEAPAGSSLALAIDWTDGLVFADSDCEHWLAPESEQVLKGNPRPGDECVVSASGTGPTATLNFSTPPAGLEEESVTITATRLLTSDGNGVDELKTGPDSEFGEASVDIELPPYPFWMEVEDLGPSESGDDVAVIIHHVMEGGGADPETTLEFDVGLPGFVAAIDETHFQCGDRGSTNCFATFSSDAEDERNTERRIPMRLDVADGGGVGLLEVNGASLNGIPEGVDEQVLGAQGLLVSEYLFDVDMTLGFDPQPEGGETATAFIQVSGAELPAEVGAYSEGRWEKTLQLDWPDGLILDGQPEGCTLLPDRRCTLPWLETGEGTDIKVQFIVDDRFDGDLVSASGAGLRHDPTTAADRSDGRTQEPEDLGRFAHWIGSASCSLDGQCE